MKTGDKIDILLLEDLLEGFDMTSPLKRITRDNEWVLV